MKRELIAALSFLVMACPEAHADDWTIEPGVRVGQIRKDTSEQALIKVYGQGNVRRTKIDVGEGTFEDGTLLFPDEPAKTLTILWKTETRTAPKTVEISSEKTVWKTKNGITIGTTLKEIEKVNQKPFLLTGFAWDYSGTILHGDGGRIKELGVEDLDKVICGRTLLLRLMPGSEGQSSPEYASVIGEQAFSSAHTAMQKLNPKVYDIVVSFDGTD